MRDTGLKKPDGEAGRKTYQSNPYGEDILTFCQKARKEKNMILEEIIWEQLESYVQQQKASFSGDSKNTNFLEKAITLLTIDRYINQLSNWENNHIDSIVLQPFLDSWEKLKGNIKI
jgi:hypothetical protein